MPNRRAVVFASLIPAAIMTPAASALGRKDRDCSDFKTRKQAQKFFEKHAPKRDPHGLDEDHDGKACNGGES